MSFTQGTLNAGVAGGAFRNINAFADPDLAGQGLYQNATIQHIGSLLASANNYDYRVSSFNTASGAWLTSQFIAATVNFLDLFEVHSRLPPAQKDLAIDDAIKKIRVRQEVGIPAASGAPDFYSIEGAASPHYVSTVLDAYYFSSPDGSIVRGKENFTDFLLLTTATGREIRINPRIGAGQQLVLDAVLELTLGASDFATINIPDDRWILTGAAAAGFNMLIAQSPGQNAGALAERRAEMASEFSRLSGRFRPDYAQRIRLSDPWE